jgi:pheromone shutdown-related protein TraB
MESLIIVGTSHIARESVNKVRKAIEEFRPDVVAVELDARRYQGLMGKQKQRLSFYAMRKVGVKGFLFALIGGYVSKKLGRMVGVEPGEDMKSAIKMALKHDIKVALIDQDIEITLKRFSQALTWREKWKIFSDIVRGFFFPKREMEKYGLGKFDLSKVPPDELVVKMIGIIRERYPSIYKVLIEERNKVMAEKLKGLVLSGKRVVAVVGAGHVAGIMDILREPEYSYAYTFDGEDLPFSDNYQGYSE